MKKISKAIIVLAFLCSCQNQTKMEHYRDDAIGEYEWIKADMGMEQLKFDGPLIRERIEKFDIDTFKNIFGWYYIHKSDTFWIYVEKSKNGKLKSDGVYFSSNFDTLRLNWKKWEKDK